LDPGFTGYDSRQLVTTPWGMEGAVLQGGVIDQAMEVLVQRTCDLRRSTGAGVVSEAWRAWVGKAMDPLTERSIDLLYLSA
jgi:hypothetical protein